MTSAGNSFDAIDTADPAGSAQNASTTTPPEKPKLNVVRIIAALLILSVGVAIMAVTSSSGVKANTDFISYWSTGQQLVRHRNPYDVNSVMALERSVGYTQARPEFMRNLPPALFLAYPLGFMGERVGSVVWSLLILGALMVSIRLIWILHGRRADGLNLLGYCFPPVLACLICGQVGVFLLLGMVLFLYFYKDKPLVAGFGLFLCTLKPHLFVPFGVAFLVWSVARRQYKVLASTVGFFLASAALALWMDPHCWAHYFATVKTQNVQDKFIPCVSTLFRALIDRHLFWLQFVPVMAGACWAVWYFTRNRRQWDWRRHGLTLLLVSVLVAPYAWFMDEAVVLPAIMAGLYCVSSAKRSMLPYWCIGGVALLEVFAGIAPNTGFYIWTSAAWLLWYLYSQKSSRDVVAG